MIPTLQQQEYARWSDQRDYNQQARLHALNAMLGLEDDAYKQYGDKVDRLYYEDKEGYTRNEAADKKAWDRGWQELEWDTKQEKAAYDRALDEAKMRATYFKDLRGLAALLGLTPEQLEASLGTGTGGGGGSGSDRGNPPNPNPQSDSDLTPYSTAYGDMQRAYETMTTDQFEKWLARNITGGRFTYNDVLAWSESSAATDKRKDERADASKGAKALAKKKVGDTLRNFGK